MLRLLRPVQWIKNGFVLAPLVFAGEFTQPWLVSQAMIATLLFCAAASLVYIFNDLCDMAHDRTHPVKRFSRPLAAGQVSVPTAWVAMGVLAVVLALGAVWQPMVIAVIAGYILLNVLYSVWLKHQPVLDIFCVAASFVLRCYAGAVAIDRPLSAWMFVTTLSLALYLAAVKRRQELLIQGNQSRRVLGHYTVELVDRYAQIAATCAVMFYSLFVVTTQPGMVVTLPLVMYGMFRYWYLVEQGQGESPTRTLLCDGPLLLTVVAWGVLCVWVLWPWAALAE